MSRSSALALALALAIPACNALTGASELTATGKDDPTVVRPAPEGGVMPPSGDAMAEGGTDAAPPQIPGWSYRMPIMLISDDAKDLTNHVVLVTFPQDFDGGHAKADGADLRFRAPGATADLSHYIEAWPSTGPKLVWVNVPSIPKASATTIYAFYGNAGATLSSNFAATFPRAIRTAGGGAGNFVATTKIDVDSFELRAGDTLTLTAGMPLEIRARRIILDGTIDGTAFGHGPGGLGSPGTGPGAGQISASNGAGGGGYGGAGGNGGSDGNLGGGGAGGPVNGTPSGDDIAMGSGGGSPPGRLGGAGGASISIFGWKTTATGVIRANGAPGLGGGSGQCSGGGSGGGILFGASILELAGAQLEAKGGDGGAPSGSAADGGGGGGGGRIKLHRRAKGSYTAPASMLVSPGAAGAGGGSGAPGIIGSTGTTDVNQASSLLTGVETMLGAEEKMP